MSPGPVCLYELQIKRMFWRIPTNPSKLFEACTCTGRFSQSPRVVASCDYRQDFNLFILQNFFSRGDGGSCSTVFRAFCAARLFGETAEVQPSWRTVCDHRWGSKCIDRSDWLLDWWIVWLFDQLIDWLFDLSTDWLIDWSIDCSIVWLIDWLIDWLMCLIDCLIEFDWIWLINFNGRHHLYDFV